ncbi:MAG: PAS domain S-box protein [Balneolales bacterium]
MINATKAQAIFKASPTPQIILKPDKPQYTIIEVNNAYLQVTNASEKDLIGRPFFEAFSTSGEPSDEAGEKNMRKALEEVVTLKEHRTLDVQKYDIPIWGTDKVEQKYWIPHNCPVLNENGDIDFIVHTPVDVTDRILLEERNKAAKEKIGKETAIREKIQQQLSDEKDFAELLINSLPGLFYLFDDEGEFCRWNKNAEELTGYAPEEILQMHPLMFIPEAHKERVGKAIEKTLSNGKAEIEAPLLTKDGRVIPFFFDSVMIVLNGRKHIIGTGLDISDLVKERRKRMRFAQIIEETRNEVYITDEKTFRFIYANAGARENLGYTLDELKKMSPLDIIAEDEPDKIKHFIRQLTNGTVDKVVFNTVHCRADGSHYDVEVHLQVSEHDGQKVFVAIILDITERVQIEAQVKASLKEKEVLLNEIHHRVKNNLAIVSSLLHWKSQTVKDNEVKDILTESEGRVQSMALIHELLYKQEDFSNIEFGAYLDKLLQNISSNFKKQEVSISTEVNADPVYLEIKSAVPCALICHELICNAYKHAFAGRKYGKISINLKHLKDKISLVVKDNGIGIPQKKEENTMGLMLIHGLVSQLKGTVTLKTEDGTSFNITFPAEEEPKSAPDNHSPTPVF